MAYRGNVDVIGIRDNAVNTNTIIATIIELSNAIRVPTKEMFFGINRKEQPPKIANIKGGR